MTVAYFIRANIPYVLPAVDWSTLFSFSLWFPLPSRKSGEGDGGLDAGPALIWPWTLSKGFGIDSFTLAESAIVSTPYVGVAATVPGLIEAEEVDDGGQWLAYYDTSPNNRGKVNDAS